VFTCNSLAEIISSVLTSATDSSASHGCTKYTL
jgi:hypothetical protein